MGPANGILGDNTGVDLPQKADDDSALTELKAKAKYSRSKEFQELKAQMELKIKFYQQYLPDGRPVGSGDIPKPEEWIAANLVIGELQQVIDGYQMAEDMVKELNKTDAI